MLYSESQDIRKAEKLRRELQLRAEDAASEAAKEKKLREKSDSLIKQLEKDMPTSMAAAAAVAAGTAAAAADSNELGRLKAELERMEAASQESLAAAQSKHAAESAAVRDQLEDAERRVRAYEMDVQTLREKLDQARIDSIQVQWVNRSVSS